MKEELKQVLGNGKVKDNISELQQHSEDESSHDAALPDVVCYPASTEEVQTIVRIASKHETPIVSFGIGSGLEGQAIPVCGGITIDFSNMNQLIDFSPEDMTVTVAPGMTRTELNRTLNKQGLHFPIDPGADASIGGMTATNASGTTAVKYGSMRDQLLDMEVVLMDGRVIHTGSHAKKSSSGYHLTGLFCGSEGTLGMITEITLQVHGIPEAMEGARCTFSTIDECTHAAYQVLLHDISIHRMELVDKASIKQVNGFGGYDFPEENSLFLECAGAKAEVEAQIEKLHEIMQDAGCKQWDAASTTEERNHLWKARHEMSTAFRHQHGKGYFGTDICVPMSKLPEMVHFARELLDESGLAGGILGHVGDGNFHTLIAYDRDSSQEVKAAGHLNEQLVYRAIDLKGTCTGEHGVGLGKKKYQYREHGEALSVMKEMKYLLDPKQLLNPAKIFE
ncbi:MAG TPA: FAD-linked oxidase C-terminal domain-containing protein [Pseudogracilibacillus sp.]|nr:FAD-linked oxidase C-terminal domain-containing protein [Pseudogracilibacillus sp.]